MCCWDVQVSLQQPVLHCRVVRWGLLVLSLSLSLFLFSLPSVSTSSFSILFVFCAAAFSSVCRYYCSGCILMKVQWSERPSGAHHSQHLISGRQLPNVKLVVYSTTVPATLYFFSTTFIQRLELLCRLRLLRVDWLLLLICDQSDGAVGGTQWEDVASHFEIDSKKKQKNTKADNRKHFGYWSVRSSVRP